ncbi:MAG: glycerophosphodiester phosphodiesterase [Sphingobium sp.]|jgi:glycerophosphoryl diester phosphodiesterase|nr:glycerophosphodiester phosphodiesterase [Sphingobium sp.]MCI1271212.1 glycerophosphodiester phosphodiesterase [Sphingobium sp.]MCI1755443.1 glycerophosphodiester phosphodiesterase [Sphingobium sp.]MCI2052187.1 glycerophosphodiester phosphodiesterase [Sphingobium sp.]
MTGRAAFLAMQDYAHRGLHGEGTGLAENSLPAFEAALIGGFGAECDVRLSADGIAVVFHDATLERLTDAHGPVSARTAAELDAIALHDNGGPIPRLSALLALMAGKQPLLIEIKIDGIEPVGPLCAAVRDDLAGYDGRAAIMSFDPRVGRWFAAHAPEVVRGLVVTEEDDKGWWGTFKRHLALRHADPDFLGYDIRDLPGRFPARARAKGLPVLSWTVRRPEHWQTVRQYADAAIFEGEAQPRRG